LNLAASANPNNYPNIALEALPTPGSKPISNKT